MSEENERRAYYEREFAVLRQQNAWARTASYDELHEYEEIMDPVGAAARRYDEAFDGFEAAKLVRRESLRKLTDEAEADEAWMDELAALITKAKASLEAEIKVGNIPPEMEAKMLDTFERSYRCERIITQLRAQDNQARAWLKELTDRSAEFIVLLDDAPKQYSWLQSWAQDMHERAMPELIPIDHLFNIWNS